MPEDPWGRERLFANIGRMISQAVRTSEDITRRWLTTGTAPHGAAGKFPPTVLMCHEHGGLFQALYKPPEMADLRTGVVRCPACIAMDARVAASSLVTRAELDGLRREIAALKAETEGTEVGREQAMLAQQLPEEND